MHRPAHHPAWSRRRAVARGFSLMEMMLVLIIMGILASVATINLVGASDKARIKATKASLHTIKQAMDGYRADTGRYPSQEEGLGDALIRTQYLEKMFQDAWKQDFIYYDRHPVDDQLPFEILSVGADGIEGTQDDISVWQADE